MNERVKCKLISLFNLLKAYSLTNKEIGYCQGMSFIANTISIILNDETVY